MPLRTSHKRRRSRVLLIVLAAAVLLMAAAAVLFVSTHVYLNGSMHSVRESSVSVPDADVAALQKLSRMKSLQSVNLESPQHDPDVIRSLSERFPDCSLSFQAVLSEGIIDSDCESVSVSNADDFHWIPYLKNLKSIYLNPVRLPADDSFLKAALACRSAMPGLNIYYSDGSPEDFLLNSSVLDYDFSDSDADRIEFILPFLPSGSSAILPDTLSQEDAELLVERYPDLSFLLHDKPADAESAVIPERMETDALLDLLSTYQNLSEIDLSGTLTDWEQIAAVSDRFPDATILFKTEIYGTEFTSDTEYLILDGIRIDDLSPIERLLPASQNLKQIDMCGCGVPDEEMAAFRDRYPDKKIVWTVDLKHWQLRTDATHFATWNRIKTDENGYIVTARNVGGNTSKSLAPLQYCTDLIALDLGHNKITDLSFLSGLKKLKYLIIALNEVTDLTPLSGLSELKYLEIFSNENIRDISPLSGLTKLEALCMSDTKVTDISPLYNNQALRRLYLQGYRFDKQAREEIAKALPDCTVLYKTLGSTGSDWRQSDYYPEMRKALGWKVD